MDSSQDSSPVDVESVLTCSVNGHADALVVIYERPPFSRPSTGFVSSRPHKLWFEASKGHFVHMHGNADEEGGREVADMY